MRILIVEDELDLANALARGLCQQGYAVDIAEDGERGWELGDIYDYDFLILDLNLPDMDGLEVCRRLRASRPGLLILMLTARDRITDKIVGLDLGADDYLTKPFHFRVHIHSVEDSGIGIAPEEKSHIFERFYRIERSRAQHRGGSGLGLSIAAHIVQLHGGRIRVESTPGVESIFTIWLPASGGGFPGSNLTEI